LGECLRRNTHREYLLWEALWAAEWDEPDRHDHYLMRVAAEVRRTLMKKPGDPIDLDDFKVKFKQAGAGEGSALTPGQRLAVSKAAWLGVVGPANVKKVNEPRRG
jgi:hypothetical protein